MSKLFSCSILSFIPPSKKSLAITMISGVVISLMVTGCEKKVDSQVSDGTTNSDMQSQSEVEDTESKKLKGLSYSANDAKVHGAGKSLTVYTYDSFTSEWGPAPKLKTIFEKDCQCKLDFVPFEDGVTMFNRLRMEGDNPKADVIIGLDNNLLAEAKKSKLFATTSLDLSKLKLPIEWSNQTFIPYDYGQYAFIYDKNKLQSPPTSLKALIENQNISIIYQDPRTSTVGRGLLAWVNSVYGDQSAKAWDTLSKHTVTVGKGWSESYGAFLKGESDMVLSYNTSPLYHQINENKDNYLAAKFDEGHIVQVELASRLKASDTPELAEDFLAFLLTPNAQKTIALSNIMLPVIETQVNEKFDKFAPYKTLEVPMPEDKISKQQIKVWQVAVSQ